MSDSARAEMVGLPDAVQAFRRLKRNARGPTLAAAVEAALLLPQNAAKIKAPKRTRTLSRSIHVEIIEERETYAEGAVGTDVAYAEVQEFGGVVPAGKAKVFGKPLGREIVIPAHPYMRPAWDEKLTAMKRELAAVLKKLLLGGVS